MHAHGKGGGAAPARWSSYQECLWRVKEELRSHMLGAVRVAAWQTVASGQLDAPGESAFA
jgi:hypothetical protein